MIFFEFLPLITLTLVVSGFVCANTNELLPNKDTQQGNQSSTAHNSLLNLSLKLAYIIDKLTVMQKPCSGHADGTVSERLNKVEQDMSKALDVIKGDIVDNRVRLTAHNQLLNEIQLDAKAKQEEFRQFYQEVKHYMAENTTQIGTTYIRWGRMVCPENGSEAVFNGYAGGSHYTHSGGAASMLCLPIEPEWSRYSDKLEASTGYVYGAEYQDGQDRADNLLGTSHHNQDVPCVLCDVKTRSSMIMIPGKKSCFSGWTFEYTGYLMTGRHNHPSHKSASDYYCVDKEPEDIPGGHGDHNGYLLYFVESRCGSLRCPPYKDGRELTCVVCTK